MAHESEAHRDWRIEPGVLFGFDHQVGYTYEGDQGQHQGEFVPIHHWSDRAQAEAMIASLKAGDTRAVAVAKGAQA